MRAYGSEAKSGDSVITGLPLETKIREMFGEFDCGCDNRQETMGAGNWKLDAIMVAAACALVIAALIASKR